MSYESGVIARKDDVVTHAVDPAELYEYAGAKPFEANPPDGIEMRGSCLPRLALAITDRGSLVGVLGHVVWT